MKSVIALACVGLASASDFLMDSEKEHFNQYAKYVAKYNKSYLSTEEYEMRKGIFVKNHLKIMVLNSKNGTAKYDHNHMSDWTDAEYKQLLGRLPTPAKEEAENVVDEPYQGSNGNFNWQSKLKSMNVIKNQGQCGSCWAFSTIGSVESATELKNGKYVSLSEQQLVDCSHNGNEGCNGGLYETAFTYLESHGSESEATYPYTGENDYCGFDKTEVVNDLVDGQHELPSQNAQALIDALKKQPVSVSVEADQDAWQFYSNGVVSLDQTCGHELDHAVLAIGYGEENGKPYFLIRNSWGPNWGERGLIKLEHSATVCSCGCIYDDSVTVHLK